MRWILGDKMNFKTETGTFLDGWMSGRDDPEVRLLDRLYCIGVGDYTCAEYGDVLDATITDGKTHRKEFDGFSCESCVTVVNPAGEISSDLFQTVADMLTQRSGQSSHIVTAGEEDLAVLPVILFGRDGDVVLWGNPYLGRTEYLVIDSQSKMRALEIMSRCGRWIE